jgi:hypothetical protein
MPFTVRFRGGFLRPFLVEDILDGALTEQVMKRAQEDESGKAVGLKMATWSIWLLSSDGSKQKELDGEQPFPASPGSTVNVWVECGGGAPAAGEALLV